MKLRYTFIILFITLILPVGAQKITLGSCQTRDGGEYKGEMQSGKPHGKGKTVWKNGNTFEGQYEKGKRQGYGVFTFFDGEKYEGQWVQDHQHGKGTFYYSNNNKYVGLWYRDEQEGHGIMSYYNGDTYEGLWRMGKRHGKGRYKEKSQLPDRYRSRGSAFYTDGGSGSPAIFPGSSPPVQ